MRLPPGARTSRGSTTSAAGRSLEGDDATYAPVVTGRVIFVLGTSSDGKTSTAGALQELLAGPYLLLGLDDVFRMVPERWGSAGGPGAGGFW